ncbi:hypothetical protein, partial [Bradyrhizobium sp. SUTN9-2]|uniref:hypothetical protein n=1 Tax=Bradyrhizobium sp. SUTN9-2 TaxID=1167456 RepID=UPI00195DBCF8
MFERNVANRTKSRFGSLGGSFGAEQCGLGGLADHKRPDQEGADSDDLARVYRFDLARGARRSGCLVSGIGEAAGSTLNRGLRPFFVCCWS